MLDYQSRVKKQFTIKIHEEQSVKNKQKTDDAGQVLYSLH